jgi:hypothetical protein
MTIRRSATPPLYTPGRVKAERPELPGIHEALGQLGRGERVTARCSVCGAVLEAVEVPVTGALVILCATGCTRFRARRAPTRG